MPLIKNLPLLKELKSLYIDITQAEVTEDNLIQLFHALPNIEQLSLGLGETPLTHTGLEILANILSNLSKIKTFELRAEKTKITDFNMQSLSNHFLSFTVLEQDIQSVLLAEKLTFHMRHELKMMKSSINNQ